MNLEGARVLRTLNKLDQNLEIIPVISSLSAPIPKPYHLLSKIWQRDWQLLPYSTVLLALTVVDIILNVGNVLIEHWLTLFLWLLLVYKTNPKAKGNVLLKHLISIFPPKKSLSSQSNSSFTEFANKIESLVACINTLMIAELGSQNRKTVIKMNGQVTLSTFKNGLRTTQSHGISCSTQNSK